ncbi:hypothetical protein B0T24DRAFT_594544 [Lasiosphaeria ovina]|uniref:Uncharacterized protein n=1 Tax=Lasiosphaeria ovina TaxID=92902 RepID=A0AAE0KCS3_9PEZI|nr:hypothetical protein B0T24DRAFT_594544 [Lasiosphaeria ovina]
MVPLEEVDVSFVVLTGEESGAITSWLLARKIESVPIYHLTPFGQLVIAFVESPFAQQMREAALRELGLLGQRFSRSLLAPGAKPVPVSCYDMSRGIPGPDSPDIRCQDIEDRERIEWTSEAFYSGQ